MSFKDFRSFTQGSQRKLRKRQESKSLAWHVSLSREILDFLWGNFAPPNVLIAAIDFCSSSAPKKRPKDVFLC